MRSLSTCFTLKKKSKLIFAKFRKWTSRMSYHDIELPFVKLDSEKKSIFIFAKFRKWWTSRIRHHDKLVFFVEFDAEKKVDFCFCKILRMVKIANLSLWNCAFFTCLTPKRVEFHFCKISATTDLPPWHHEYILEYSDLIFFLHTQQAKFTAG